MTKESFGNFGNVGALLALPKVLVFGALFFLGQETPEDDVLRFMKEFATPLGLLERMKEISGVESLRDLPAGAHEPELPLFLTTVHFPVLGVKIREDLKRNWRPYPWAVYLLLCVVDYYLPKMVEYAKSLKCLHEKKRQKVDREGVFADAISVLNRDDIPVSSKLDIACLQVFSSLHPVRDFAIALDVLERLTREYERRFVLPDIMNRSGFIMAVQHGLFECNERTCMIPKSTWAAWKCDPNRLMQETNICEEDGRKLEEDLDVTLNDEAKKVIRYMHHVP
jgi:hypothetical protein